MSARRRPTHEWRIDGLELIFHSVNRESVMPAEAGIYCSVRVGRGPTTWIPAFAGMTEGKSTSVD
jgi:hypothetical protein